MSYHRETKAIQDGQLLAKALLSTLTVDEQAEFDRWLTDPDHQVIYESMLGGSFQKDKLSSFDCYNEQSAYPRFLHLRNVTQQAKRRRLTKWLPYAAAVVFALAAVIFFLDRRYQHPDTELVAMEVLPGRNRAMLRLADGRTVDLSEAQKGIIVGDGIAYLDGSSVLSEQGYGEKEVSSLQLTTPKGGMYQITLSDGTEVWLNAASTLTYPSHFGSKERLVEVSGEAYFIVKHDVKRPFKVVSNDQEIEVLGTEFNISAYADETETKTTLVTGSVRLQANGIGLKLTPGEQSVFTGGKLDKAMVNVGQYTAWKDGRFHFNHTPFQEMIKQVARWYDVDVVYQGSVPQETFTGKIGRDLTLKAMLDLLDISDADIQMDGRKLIVQ